MNLYNILSDKYQEVIDMALQQLEESQTATDINKAEGFFEGVQYLWEVLESELQGLSDV